MMIKTEIMSVKQEIEYKFNNLLEKTKSDILSSQEALFKQKISKNSERVSRDTSNKSEKASIETMSKKQSPRSSNDESKVDNKHVSDSSARKGSIETRIGKLEKMFFSFKKKIPPANFGHNNTTVSPEETPTQPFGKANRYLTQDTFAEPKKVFKIFYFFLKHIIQAKKLRESNKKRSSKNQSSKDQANKIQTVKRVLVDKRSVSSTSLNEFRKSKADDKLIEKPKSKHRHNKSIEHKILENQV